MTHFRQEQKKKKIVDEADNYESSSDFNTQIF